jgi:hypothetical protein
VTERDEAEKQREQGRKARRGYAAQGQYARQHREKGEADDGQKRQARRQRGEAKEEEREARE